MSTLGPPSYSGLQGHPFHSLSIICNNPNGEMDEEHIRVWSTIQTSRKQNASNRRFQVITKINPV